MLACLRDAPGVSQQREPTCVHAAVEPEPKSICTDAITSYDTVQSKLFADGP